MDVKVIVARDGDGWLSVDEAEWIEAKLGEPDHDLTEDLTTWAEEHCVDLRYRDTAPIDWARSRFEEISGPGEGDDHPVWFNSANSDNILENDIVVLLMRVGRGAASMTLAVVDDSGIQVYVLGPDQEWVDVVDWSRAYGRCPKAHDFVVERACYLHSGRNSYRLTEQCTRPDPDVPYEGGFVACPECSTAGQAIQFMA